MCSFKQHLLKPLIRERDGELAREGEEERSGFSAALYPNPGFGNGMTKPQVGKNTITALAWDW